MCSPPPARYCSSAARGVPRTRYSTVKDVPQTSTETSSRSRKGAQIVEARRKLVGDLQPLQLREPRRTARRCRPGHELDAALVDRLEHGRQSFARWDAGCRDRGAHRRCAIVPAGEAGDLRRGEEEHPIEDGLRVGQEILPDGMFELPAAVARRTRRNGFPLYSALELGRDSVALGALRGSRISASGDGPAGGPPSMASGRAGHQSAGTRSCLRDLPAGNSS